VVRSGLLCPWCGQRHQLANGVQDVFPQQAPGSQRIILKEKFPDVGDFLCRARLKSKTLLGIHCGERFFSSSSSRIFREIVGRKAASGGQFVQAGFRLGFEVTSIGVSLEM
jgi:hypothetical protein